jgi:hypothetical protein
MGTHGGRDRDIGQLPSSIQAHLHQLLCSLWIQAHTFLDLDTVEPVNNEIGDCVVRLPLNSVDLVAK